MGTAPGTILSGEVAELLPARLDVLSHEALRLNAIASTQD
jgi:hypothetical protein